MAFSYDDVYDSPVRHNEGKVDWTLLPWDENLVNELVVLFDSYNTTFDKKEVLLSCLLGEKVLVKPLLVVSLMLLSSNKQYSFSNLPWDALEQVCRVFQHGVDKYSRDNYKIAPGLPLEGYIQSIWRHTVSYLKGDLLDEDSKLPNLAHIACNCFMYLWTQKEYH